MRGPSIEVVKAYEQFIRQLDDRRLAPRIRSAASRYDAFARDTYTDQLIVEAVAEGPESLDIAELTLLRDGMPEDRVEVGAPQDADAGQSAAVLPGTGWSDPASGSASYRSLKGEDAGQALFHLWFLYPESTYEVAVRYRSASGGTVRVRRGNRLVGELPLPADERVEP